MPLNLLGKLKDWCPSIRKRGVKMFIVYIDKHKHSAWITCHEAKHQIVVLESYGYKKEEYLAG